MKRIFIANPHGFCAGVRRAVNAIEAELAGSRRTIYCLNEIVHNEHVVNSLRERGVMFVKEISSVPSGAPLFLSAHGVSPEVRMKAAEKGLKIIDATCPFVEKLHAEARRFAGKGYKILLIGHRGHDEIVGVTGEAPDSVTVIQNCTEADNVVLPDTEKIAVITQTTLSVDDSMRIVERLRLRFPHLLLSAHANICHATSSRQMAVKELCRHSGIILVLGSENSSNSRRLVEVARRCGADSCLISSPAELDAFCTDNAENIGLTAGASTPESFVADVIATLRERGFGRVIQLEASMKDAQFKQAGSAEERA